MFKFANLQAYLTNPTEFVYGLTIKEKRKTRTILTYTTSFSGQNLRTYHKKLLEEVLSALPSCSRSYAYKKGRAIADAVFEHLNSRLFIKLDIHSFFESIAYERFVKKIAQFGYSPDLFAPCFYKGHCSQGMVTSPAISDFYLFEFDAKVEEYLLSHPGLYYSRYSDDILLSSAKDDFGPLEELAQFVERELAKEGLVLNEGKKVRYDLSKHTSAHFIGLNIGNGKVSIGKGKILEALNAASDYYRQLTFLSRINPSLLNPKKPEEALVRIHRNKGGKKGKLANAYAQLFRLKSRAYGLVNFLRDASPASYARFLKKHLSRFGKEWGKPVTVDFLTSVSSTRIGDGVTANEENGLLYIFNEAGHYYSVSASYNEQRRNAMVHVLVPSAHNGYLVREVAAKGFEGCLNIESISLPPTIDAIGEKAFASCPKLSNLKLSSQVRQIGDMAFVGTQIKNIAFADTSKLASNGMVGDGFRVCFAGNDEHYVIEKKGDKLLVGKSKSESKDKIEIREEGNAIALDADKERLLAYLRDHIYANATGSSKSRLSAVEKEVYAGTDFIDAACLSVLYELNPFCRGIGNVSACFLPNVCLDSNGLRLSRRENGKEESLILDFADGSSTYASFEIDGCVYRRYSCYVPCLRLDQLPIFGYSLASLCQSSPSSKILLSKFRLNNVISETPVELDEGAAEIFDFLSPHQLPFLSLKGKPKHYLRLRKGMRIEPPTYYRGSPDLKAVYFENGCGPLVSEAFAACPNLAYAGFDLLYLGDNGDLRYIPSIGFKIFGDATSEQIDIIGGRVSLEPEKAPYPMKAADFFLPGSLAPNPESSEESAACRLVYPGSFAGLEYIETLNLHQAELILPGAFSELPSLKTLNIFCAEGNEPIMDGVEIKAVVNCPCSSRKSVGLDEIGDPFSNDFPF